MKTQKKFKYLLAAVLLVVTVGLAGCQASKTEPIRDNLDVEKDNVEIAEPDSEEALQQESEAQAMEHMETFPATEEMTASADTEKAENAFKQALLYSPDFIEAKYNLALLYENNNKDKAKELYIEILEQDPTFEEAKNALNDMSSSEIH